MGSRRITQGSRPHKYPDVELVDNSVDGFFVWKDISDTNLFICDKFIR